MAKQKGEKYIPPRHAQLCEEFNASIEPTYNVNIHFSLFGIRNLVQKSEKPIIKIRMTNWYPNDEKAQIIEIDE